MGYGLAGMPPMPNWLNDTATKLKQAKIWYTIREAMAIPRTGTSRYTIAEPPKAPMPAHPTPKKANHSTTQSDDYFPHILKDMWSDQIPENNGLSVAEHMQHLLESISHFTNTPRARQLNVDSRIWWGA